MRFIAPTTCAVIAILAISQAQPSTSQAGALTAAAEFVPVDKSMHEFMEYYFQPTYKRLKQTMAAEDKSNSDWKSVKADAMILAEGGNLLLTRTPSDSEKKAAWETHSKKVRELGRQLYLSAKKKDTDKTNSAYRAMLNSCNQCHVKFARGKYQLKP